MFEPRRYFENADRRRRIFDNLEILCAPEFEELFDKLFGGLGDRVEKPRVYSIRVPDRTKEDIARTQKMRDDFHWKIDDSDVDDEGLDEGDAYEDEEPANVPPSIFDILKSGKEFKDIVPSTQPKHTEIYNQAFGLDDNGNPIPLPEDDELDDEEDEEPYIHEPDVVYADDDEDEEEEVPGVKNPFVFIANRLTFLIKTTQPIIWDTSTVATPSEDCIFVAFDKHKNPKLDLRVAAQIAHKVNIDEDIQAEISEFLDGTEWETIYCVPHVMEVKGEERLGFVFAVTTKSND